MNLLRTLEKYHYIINHHARIAQGKLPAYARNSVSIEDLEQEGRIAFEKACQYFDETQGVRFETVLTEYLIRMFSNYIAGTCAKMRLPLAETLSLDEMASEAPSNDVNHYFLACTDPQYERVEFDLSLEQAKNHVSDPAKNLISFLQSGEWEGKTQKEISGVLNIALSRLRKSSKEVLIAMYGGI